MIPVRDDQPRFSTPYVTYFLVGLNLVIFLFEASLTPHGFKVLLFQLGMVPANITGFLAGTHKMGADGGFPSHPDFHVSARLVDARDRQHVVPVDLRRQHRRLSGALQISALLSAQRIGRGIRAGLLNPHSSVPTVGASGAIAGVLGAYFLLYPEAKVLIWFPIFFLFYLPAWVTLGYWFAMQFVSGAATSLASYSDTRGGVAFWAHVGGFLVGIVLIKLFPERPRRIYRYGARVCREGAEGTFRTAELHSRRRPQCHADLGDLLSSRQILGIWSARLKMFRLVRGSEVRSPSPLLDSVGRFRISDKNSVRVSCRRGSIPAWTTSPPPSAAFPRRASSCRDGAPR